MIKTAVIGASGYIGSYFWKSYRTEFPNCVGTTFSKNASGLQKFDIRSPDLASLRLAETGHQAVLIASAHPNINYCENNRQDSYDVNVKGTLELGRQIEALDLSAIFLSTDYVFSGTSGPYDDCDKPQPTTEYGRQKALVEVELPKLVRKCLILRLSKVYGTQKGDGTLLDEIANKLASGSDIKMAKNQLFCPTHVNDIVEVVHSLQAIKFNGLLNLCSPQGWSRYDVAMLMAEAMQANRNQVHPISLHDLPGLHSRPLDTRMRPSKLVMEVKPQFTLLQQSISQIVQSW